MITNTLAIPLGFIVLSAVLLWCLIGSKGKWWVKLALIAALPSFGLAVWKSVDSYLGWPTPDSIPEKAIMLWGDVQEGDPKTGDPGTIYLWLRPFDEKLYQKTGVLNYQADFGAPRAYKMPYSRELHKGVNGALGMIKEGKVVVIDKNLGKGSGKEGDGNGEKGNNGRQGEGTEPENGDRFGRGNNGFSDDPNGPLFYELPPPNLPNTNSNN